MSAVATTDPKAANPVSNEVTQEEIDKVERALIDASTRAPVLAFFASALLWLLVGSIFVLVNSMKSHSPDFLGDYAWLTYGRTFPVARNILVYGWASMAGIGIAIWLMARLCRVELRQPTLLIFGAVLWNCGVASGVVGILAGQMRSAYWLEFPKYATHLLFIGYVFLAIWAVVMFRFRKPGYVFVSQWYLLGALFWFPWLYAVSNFMMFGSPVRGVESPIQGVVLSVINAWFEQGLMGFWLAGIALATAYYMIPKVTGRPIHSYALSTMGFWTFAFLFGLTGTQHLTGGPVPAWLPTLSITAIGLMMVPVATVAVNHHMTMQGQFSKMHYSPTLRFVVFGAMCYTLASAVWFLSSLRSVAKYLHFSIFSQAQNYLWIYAFVTMIFFGSMYYIIPRLVGCEWRSAWLIKMHFWGTGYGIGLMIVMLAAGGMVQGMTLFDPQAPFATAMEKTLPYLRGTTLAAVLLLVGHTVFILHFLLMLLRLGLPEGAPTLLVESKEQEAAV